MLSTIKERSVAKETPSIDSKLNSIKDTTNNDLYEFLSKKNIWTWFSDFLPSCDDLYPKIGTLSNKITRYSKKTDNIESLHKTIEEVNTLFSDKEFIRRLALYTENIKTDNMLSAELFSNGTFSGLKNLLIAKIRKNRLTYTAINTLKKKEILDILQVNNNIKDSDGNIQHVVDVAGHGINKIYTLQNWKKAKIVDNKLEIIPQDTKSDGQLATEEVAVDLKPIEKSDDTKETLPSLSSCEYLKISEKKGHDYTRYPVVNVDINGQSSFLIKLRNGTLFDLCVGADGKQYKIIDYLSAKENTGYTMNLVKVQDGAKIKVLRLIGEPGFKECYLETEIAVKKDIPGLKGLVSRLFKKEDLIIKEAILDISRNPNKRIFEYTTVTGKVIPQNQDLIQNQKFPFRY